MDPGFLDDIRRRQYQSLRVEATNLPVCIRMASEGKKRELVVEMGGEEERNQVKSFYSLVTGSSDLFAVVHSGV